MLSQGVGTALLSYFERAGDRGQQLGGIGERRQVNEPDAVGKVRCDASGDREREACFADAAAAAQGDKTVRGQEGGYLICLLLPAYQVADWPGQPKRREGRGGRCW